MSRNKLLKIAEEKDIDLKKLFNLIEPLTELKNLVGMQSVKESMVDQILFFLQKLNKKEKCNECINCQNNINELIATLYSNKPIPNWDVKFFINTVIY